MLKRIRRRFVWVVFIVVFVILLILMTFINVTNYRRVTDSVDEILDILAMNNGDFIHRPSMPPDIGPETPYETRFFTVRYDIEAEKTFVDISNIASVDEKNAILIADSILEENEEYGYYLTYRYKVCEVRNGLLVICINCDNRLNMVNIFLAVSIIFSIITIIGICVIMFFLSKKILSPIINSYERQSRFVTNASHELKTPLTIISANNELIELEYGQNESTEAINKQINRLTQMVLSLTKLSKIDNPNSDNHFKEVNIGEIVREMIELYNDNYKNLINSEVEDILYIGDAGLIGQLINVLLDNAIKYNTGIINVYCKKISIKMKQKVEIVVENSILEENKIDEKKYFERFFRSDSARASNIEGSGIGLSIASDIVNYHNGSIKIEEIDKMFKVKIIL